ncbi:MAG: protein phosphatase 2C domain-containing protein [Trueperaceae bacterium]|nr:protein phosphatase 2C domain-containing protein [Trueperaceae bacterium]
MDSYNEEPLETLSDADVRSGVYPEANLYEEDDDVGDQSLSDFGGLEPDDTPDHDPDLGRDLSELDPGLPYNDDEARFEREDDDAATETPSLRTWAPTPSTSELVEAEGSDPDTPPVHTPAAPEPDVSPSTEPPLPTEASAETSAPAGPTDEADTGGFLEEVTYPSQVENKVLELGERYTWGELTFVVDEVLSRGWYKARQDDDAHRDAHRDASDDDNRDDSDAALLVRPHPTDTPWHDLPQHRQLPKVRYHGDDGFAVDWADGEPLAPTLPFADCLAHLVDLARLTRFFEAQGWALVDLEPGGLLVTERGLKLRYPPRLARIGEPLPNSVYRQGYTPPEIAQGEPATGREGVYLLSALLVYLYSGTPLPAEGPSLLEIRRYREPGLPQLLYAGLSSARDRPSPEEFTERLRSLQRPAPPAFELAAATTVGLNPERAVNEDSYGYVQEVVESFDEPEQLLRACVADGMGGEEAGEVASQAAVKAFCSAAPPHPLDDVGEQARWNEQLVWQANDAVLKALAGASGGCTFTSVLVVGTRLTLGHVGDSRAYLFSGDTMTALSLDHSLVRALVANGMLTEEEAAVSPDRNKVLRSLGSVRRPQERYVDGLGPALDRVGLELSVGDVVVLMSDGVCGEISARQLEDSVREHHQHPQTLADALVDAALGAGANDNATVVVLRRTR